MSTYNLDSIKEKITSLTSAAEKKAGTGGGERAKINWWKPEIGSHDIRFLPLLSADGTPNPQPFFEVSYYDSKELTEKRFVAPAQFGGTDPLREAALEYAKDKKNRSSWLAWKKLTPKERYYAAVLVRGQEEKGVFVWELSPKICKDIYAILVHPDYAEEDMFSTENGYDFTLTVSATDKTFNGYPVKDIKLQPRRKSSKALPKKELVETVMKQIPNFEAYFKAQVKSEEELLQIRENFIAMQTAAELGVTSEGTVRGTDSAQVQKSTAAVDSAFADLET